ncbi:MAG: hypothetical protein NVS1B4_02180 [Gemmatimonadaceae bacterium]
MRRSIATLPVGSYRWSLPQVIPSRDGPTLTVVPRHIPTNYLLGYFAGPLASNADFTALRIACAVLSGRLFTEVRVRRNLTYAIEAPFLDRGASAGGFYVTTTSPDTVLALISVEVRRLQTTTLTDDQLNRVISQFVTTYFLDNETNAAQANFLARHALYQGDYRSADHFIDGMRRVTPEDIRRVAGGYMRGTKFVYLGDPNQLSARTLRGL